MRVFEAKELPEMRRELVKWTRTIAPGHWWETHKAGTRFYIPPILRGIPERQAIADLAQHQANVLESAVLYSVTREMTFLAAKTVMADYSLSMDVLPAPRGLIMWQQPVGTTEKTDRLRLKIDPETGDIEEASLHEWVEGMGRDDIAVIGASWELLPDEDGVMVVWYSDQEGLIGNFPEDQKNDLELMAMAKSIMSPVIFEREQILPFGEFGWFASDSERRLRLTVGAADHPSLPPALLPDAIERDRAVLPMLDQMTKTLIATWMLMGMRFTRQDVELPDRSSRKRLKRDGESEENISAGVRVIKMGGPLRQQKPKEGEPAYRWKKRRIVGPFIRRQWYPSEEIHKPKLIEPYIAGPEGAPIGNAEKVYLLG